MTNPRDELMALAELAVSNGECASQLEIKDAELRDSLLRNIIAVFEPRLATSRPATQVVDREAVAWPESPIAIAQRGFEKWRAKEHNKKWFRKIDGTPISNDVVVCIAQEFADTACPVMPVRQETADTSAAVLQSHALKQALDTLAEIAAARIPDCPAHYAGDELAWAQRHVGSLRHKAEIARNGIADAIHQLPTTELVNPEKMYSYNSEAKVEFEK